MENEEFDNMVEGFDGKMWRAYECDAHAAELFATDWDEYWCIICFLHDEEGEAREGFYNG